MNIRQFAYHDAKDGMQSSYVFTGRSFPMDTIQNHTVGQATVYGHFLAQGLLERTAKKAWLQNVIPSARY